MFFFTHFFQVLLEFTKFYQVFQQQKHIIFFVPQRPPFEWAPKPGGQRRAAAREP